MLKETETEETISLFATVCHRKHINWSGISGPPGHAYGQGSQAPSIQIQSLAQ